MLIPNIWYICIQRLHINQQQCWHSKYSALGMSCYGNTYLSFFKLFFYTWIFKKHLITKRKICYWLFCSKILRGEKSSKKWFQLGYIHLWHAAHRASLSWGHEDARTCNIFENLRKIYIFECTIGTQASFIILAKFDNNFFLKYLFYGILGKFLCAKISVKKFGCAKELAFRRSGPAHCTLHTTNWTC